MSGFGEKLGTGRKEKQRTERPRRVKRGQKSIQTNRFCVYKIVQNTMGQRFSAIMVRRRLCWGKKHFFFHLNTTCAGIDKELEIAYIRLSLLLLRIYERENDFSGPYVNKYGKSAR